MADSLILMVLALVVFGPRRLPQIGRQLGKLMYEFRKASNDFKFQMEEEMRNAEEAERRKREEERVRALGTGAPAETPSSAPVVDQQFPVPEAASPYPGEALYPVQPPSPESATPGESLHLQPPSIGEQISATSPNAAAPVHAEHVAEEATVAAQTGQPAETQPASAQSSDPTYYFSTEKEAAPEGSAAMTEQASHNG